MQMHRPLATALIVHSVMQPVLDCAAVGLCNVECTKERALYVGICSVCDRGWGMFLYNYTTNAIFIADLAEILVSADDRCIGQNSALRFLREKLA